MHKYHNSFENIADILQGSRLPITLWIGFVYIGTIVLQYLARPLFLESIIFTFVVVVHNSLYWFSSILTDKQSGYYFLLQGVLIFISAFLMPQGSPVILIGLLPILIAQSITIFQNKLKVFLFFIIFYGLYCVAIGINYGPQELVIFIPILFFILTIVIFYSVIYNRQVNARMRMEYYLHELEAAHKEVEKLTLANERQRMARDLHDTLAQGLAGIIMQLEAIQAHLQKGNSVRSQEIIEGSMQQARETLRDARTAIDNLREKSSERIDFSSAILNKVKKFEETTFMKIEHKIDYFPHISNLVMEHSLYIISECLSNAVKHSQAEKVSIRVKHLKHEMFIEIEDNGIGFAANRIETHFGKYGLLGLNERVRLLGGKISINSIVGTGTKLSITIPI